MLKPNSRRILVGGTVLVFFLTLAVGAYATVIVSTKTTTVTTTLPWTVSLSDIHSTTVLNVPATATITYQSTSSTASSTTTTTTSRSTTSTAAETEMVGHAYGLAAGCPAIQNPFSVTNFLSTPVIQGDSWRIDFYISDAIHGNTARLSFTTQNGVHTASQTTYAGSNVVEQQTVNVPSNSQSSDIINGQYIDFYSDGDGGQVFWVGVNGSPILFAFNFENFGVSLTPTDVAVQFVPLVQGQALQFTTLSAHIQLGNQFTTPLTHQIPLQSIFTPPAQTAPCSTSVMPVVSNTNAIQDLTGSEAQGTIIDEAMTLQ